MLTRTQFLVKERVGFLKLTDTYDIFDPASGNQIGIAHENVSGLMKMIRLLVNKRLLPTRVEVRERENGPVVLTVSRGANFLRAKVSVTDGRGTEIGRFKSKMFSLGGGFYVMDPLDNPVAEVKGDWKGWNFRFITEDGQELGKVTKKWAGIGKELFTSADNYMIVLDETRRLPPNTASLLLAAGIAIDTVYKEKS